MLSSKGTNNWSEWSSEDDLTINIIDSTSTKESQIFKKWVVLQVMLISKEHVASQMNHAFHMLSLAPSEVIVKRLFIFKLSLTKKWFLFVKISLVGFWSACYSVYTAKLKKAIYLWTNLRKWVCWHNFTFSHTLANNINFLF